MSKPSNNNSFQARSLPQVHPTHFPSMFHRFLQYVDNAQREAIMFYLQDSTSATFLPLRSRSKQLRYMWCVKGAAESTLYYVNKTSHQNDNEQRMHSEKRKAESHLFQETSNGGVLSAPK